MKNISKWVILTIFCLPFFFSINPSISKSQMPESSSIQPYFESEEVVNANDSKFINYNLNSLKYYRFYFHSDNESALIKLRTNLTTSESAMNQGYIEFYLESEIPNFVTQKNITLEIENEGNSTEHVFLYGIYSFDGIFVEDNFDESDRHIMNHDNILIPLLVAQFTLSIISIPISYRNKKLGLIFILLTLSLGICVCVDPSPDSNQIPLNTPFTPSEDGRSKSDFYYYCKINPQEYYPSLIKMNLIINDTNGVLYFNGTQTFNISSDEGNHEIFGRVQIFERSPKNLTFSVEFESNDAPIFEFYEWEDYQEHVICEPYPFLYSLISIIALLPLIFTLKNFILEKRENKKQKNVDKIVNKSAMNNMIERISSKNNPPDQDISNSTFYFENTELEKYFEIHEDHFTIITDLHAVKHNSLRSFLNDLISISIFCIIPGLLLSLLIAITGFADLCLGVFSFFWIISLLILWKPLKKRYPLIFDEDFSYLRQLDFYVDHIVLYSTKSGKKLEIPCAKISKIKIGLVTGKKPLSFTKLIQNDLWIYLKEGKERGCFKKVIINSFPEQGLEFKQIFTQLITHYGFKDCIPLPEINITIKKPLGIS